MMPLILIAIAERLRIRTSVHRKKPVVCVFERRPTKRWQKVNCYFNRILHLELSSAAAFEPAGIQIATILLSKFAPFSCVLLLLIVGSVSKV